MSHLTPAERNKLIGTLIEFWQDVLHLTHVNITWEITDDLVLDCDHDLDEDTAFDGNYVHAQTGFGRRSCDARVKIHAFVFEDPFYADVQRVSGLVGHELFHLVLQEEYAVVAQDFIDVTAGALPDEVRGLFAKQFGEVDERTVRKVEPVFTLVPVPGLKVRAA